MELIQSKKECGTQKARGLFELREKTDTMLSPFKMPQFAVFKARPTSAPLPFPIFARPCPKVPRHGFVDSRLVQDLAELQKVWDEARAADPEAELIAMQPIAAKTNAIWTSGQLTVGAGNDGATSGHNAVIFPTVPSAPVAGPYASIKESPFFEFVQDEKRPYIVQLRDGPVVPQTPDFVTAPVTVKEVIVAGGDLLEWEAKIHAAAGKEGVIVHHPGGSLASHYAVHAIVNSIPVLITREPKIGETIEPTVEAKGTPNADAIMDGVRYALTADADRNMATKFTFAVLHNVVSFDLSKPEHAKWFGAACGFAVRLGFCAAHGEARHAIASIEKTPKPGRDEVFEKYWNDFRKSRWQLRRSWTLFHEYNWGGGFGGKAWASCVRAASDLWTQICYINRQARTKRFQEKTVAATTKKAIEQLNKVLHEAHNNGVWFNKFCESKFFDRAATNPVSAAVDASPMILDVARGVAKLSSEEIGFSKLPEVVPAVADAQATLRGFAKDAGSFGKAFANVKIHVQIKTKKGNYETKDVAPTPALVAALLFGGHDVRKSLAGGSTTYVALKQDGKFLVITNRLDTLKVSEAA